MAQNGQIEAICSMARFYRSINSTFWPPIGCGFMQVLDTFGASRKTPISKGALVKLKHLMNTPLLFMILMYFPFKSKTALFSCRWYFGKIKRIEAEKKLLLQQNEHGAFLIRDSESRRNDFSLSVRDGDTVKHYRIRWQYCQRLIFFGKCSHSFMLLYRY